MATDYTVTYLIARIGKAAKAPAGRLYNRLLISRLFVKSTSAEREEGWGEAGRALLKAVKRSSGRGLREPNPLRSWSGWRLTPCARVPSSAVSKGNARKGAFCMICTVRLRFNTFRKWWSQLNPRLWAVPDGIYLTHWEIVGGETRNATHFSARGVYPGVVPIVANGASII